MSTMTLTQASADFWQAVFNDDVTSLDQVPVSKFNTPAFASPHNTPMHHAAKAVGKRVFEFAASKGGRVLMKNDLGVSPLLMLCRMGDWACVEKVKENVENELAKINKKNGEEKYNLTEVFWQALLDDQQELAQWLFGLDAKIDIVKTERRELLGDPWSANEWDSYKKSRPPYGASAFYECCVTAFKGTPLPMEIALHGANDEMLAWAKEKGVAADLSKFPLDYKVVYLFSLMSDSFNKVEFPTLAIELLEDVCAQTDFLEKEEDKMFLYFDTFLRAAEKRKEATMLKIREEGLKRFNVDFLNKELVYYVDSKFNGHITNQKMTWSAMISAVNSLTKLETKKRHATTPPQKKDDYAQAIGYVANWIERLFELGADKAAIEKGWSYSMAHLLANAGSLAGIKALENSGYELMNTKSGKKNTGKTPKEMAKAKGFLDVVSLLESIELKSAVSSTPIKPAKRKAL